MAESTRRESDAAAPERRAAEPRAWITATLRDDGTVEAVAHAESPFGARAASVHVDVPEDAAKALAEPLTAALDAVRDDLLDRADEAKLGHRIRARELGEDFRGEPGYIGPVVETEDAVYSDPGVMELPKARRERAIARGGRDDE